VRLDTLLSESDIVRSGIAAEILGDPTVDITGITHDSRRVSPGYLFACVPGGTTDGHAYAGAAVARGAVALLCERPLQVLAPQVVVPSVRRSLGHLCDALFGHPSSDLTVVGVTGTNGKTTTCAYLRAVFEANGWPATAIGTLTQTRTTPEAPELHSLLAECARGGGRAVAMEVSSHALIQHRADGVHFAAGVFTNLSAEHLDYHGSLESYFEAKAMLFEPGRVRLAVVNRDDKWGRKLLERLTGRNDRVESFGAVDAARLELTPSGSTFFWQGIPVQLQLGGRFNVSNALAAATVARGLGIPSEVVASGLSSVEGVPGRYEVVSAGQPFTVIVDYAHTPDGLGKVLEAARETCEGRLIVVFGAGGDRDREKRPLMGEVAARLADLAVITSDNPRGEDPMAIIDAVLAGAGESANVIVDPDRASAITTALSNALPGDAVVIAGKGHEHRQELGGRSIPFDDVAVARRSLQRILSSRGERR
jgi:UDP-N-acetylmuramoyl-L-alanyl-D-glutamate--2,6-diaminopimelate ligase